MVLSRDIVAYFDHMYSHAMKIKIFKYEEKEEKGGKGREREKGREIKMPPRCRMCTTKCSTLVIRSYLLCWLCQ